MFFVRTESKGVFIVLVNCKKMAELSGLSEYQLRIFAKSGRIPCLRIGEGARQIFRFNPETVLRAIEKLADEQSAAALAEAVRA